MSGMIVGGAAAMLLGILLMTTFAYCEGKLHDKPNSTEGGLAVVGFLLFVLGGALFASGWFRVGEDLARKDCTDALKTAGYKVEWPWEKEIPPVLPPIPAKLEKLETLKSVVTKIEEEKK